MQLTQNKRCVQSFVGDIDPAVGEAQPHIYLGKLLFERRYQWSDQLLADAKRRGDEYRAFRVNGYIGDAAFGFFDCVQNFGRTLIKQIAMLCWPEAARGPAEQADSKVLLQFSDAAAGNV